MSLLVLLTLAIAPPSGWVPARWPSGEATSLELVRETPVNCLLLEPAHWSREFSDAAAKAGVTTLGVIRPGKEAEANALSQKAGQLGFERDRARRGFSFEGPSAGFGCGAAGVAFEDCV